MFQLLKKSWFQQGLIGFCAALLIGFGGIESKQMQQSGVAKPMGTPQAKPTISAPIVPKMPQVTPVVSQQQRKGDRFTQTEAFLQLTRIIDLLKDESSSRYIPYLNIISDCLVKEQELKNSHYAFYHTTGNEWRLAQDVYTQLYIRQNPSGKKVGENFSFLRFDDFSNVNAQDFLVNELKKNGLVNDTGELAAILLSVNVSLFGNTGRPTSCTWDYFLTDIEHKTPDRKVYEKMMDKFGLTHKYIDELMSLMKLYDTKENTLLQIFVPQNRVDDIGYLAWSKGMPLHEESIDWIKKYMRKKSWTHKEGKHVAEWAMEDLAKQFKKEQEKNPLFKDLIESVQAGDFSVNEYLKVYRNKPWELPTINNDQVRLVFSADGLLNPASGTQFYRYSTVSKDRLKKYYQRLNEVIDKIVAEKEGEDNV
jgi:hypothetical protein